MQLDLSFDTCVPLAPQHDFPPAKDELVANTPAANKAKVVLIMHLRQHELRNVQWVRLRRSSRAKAEGSRGSYLRGFAAGSLDFARDDTLSRAKLERSVLGVGPNRLPFPKFSLENVHAQGIE